MPVAVPLVLIVIAMALIALVSSVHHVQEGHVGIYYRAGALQNRVTDPGAHIKIPFLETVHNVQISLQTDKVENIPCGTSGGVLVYFDRVEVVNRLRKEYVYETIKNYSVEYDRPWIFDKIHHELNQLCSQHTLQEVYIDLFHTIDDDLLAALQKTCSVWAPGIEVISIRVTKPRIPAAVSKNYEEMESQKTQIAVSTQRQLVARKEAETEKFRATIAAEQRAEVSKIESAQRIAEETATQEVKRVKDEIELHHEKMRADAQFYTVMKQAEANAALFSEQFLKLQAIQAIGNTTKVYYGPSINSLLLDMFEVVKEPLKKAKTLP